MSEQEYQELVTAINSLRESVDALTNEVHILTEGGIEFEPDFPLSDRDVN